MRKSTHYGPGKRLMAAALALLMILSLCGFALGDEAQAEPGPAAGEGGTPNEVPAEPEPLAEEGTPELTVTLTPDPGNVVAEGKTLKYTLTVKNAGTGALTGKSKATLKIGTDPEMELGTVSGDSGVTAERNAKRIKITAGSDGVVLPAGASVSGVYSINCQELPFDITVTFESSNDSSGDDITYGFPSVTFTQAADGLTSNSGGVVGPGGSGGTTGPTEPGPAPNTTEYKLVYHLNAPGTTEETAADIVTETSETSGAFSLKSVSEVFSSCAGGQYKVSGDWYFAGWSKTQTGFSSYGIIDYPVSALGSNRGFLTPPPVTVDENETVDVYAVWAPETNAGLFGYTLTVPGADFSGYTGPTLAPNGLTSDTNAQKYVVYDGGYSTTSPNGFTVTDAKPTASGYTFIGWYEKTPKLIALGGDTVPYGGAHSIYSLDAIWGTVSGAKDVSCEADGEPHSIDISTLTTAFTGGGVGALDSLKPDTQASRNYPYVVYTYEVTKDGKSVTADSVTADGVPQFKDAGVYEYAITATLHDAAHIRSAAAQASGITVGTVKATLTIANAAELTYHLNLPDGTDATVVDASPTKNGSDYTFAVQQIGDVFSSVTDGRVTSNGKTYYFAGWSKNKNTSTYDAVEYRIANLASGDRLLADDLTCTTTGGSSHLYAIWLKPALLGYTMSGVSASFPAEHLSLEGGGYVVLDGGYAEGDSVTVTTVKPSSTGTTFVAWYDGHGTPTMRFPGDTFTFGSSQSVYSLNAFWAKLVAKTEPERVHWTGKPQTPSFVFLDVDTPGDMGQRLNSNETIAGMMSSCTVTVTDSNGDVIGRTTSDPPVGGHIDLPAQTDVGEYTYTVAVTFAKEDGSKPVTLTATQKFIIDPVLRVQVGASLTDKGTEIDWGSRTFRFTMDGAAHSAVMDLDNSKRSGTFADVVFAAPGTYTFTVDEARTAGEALLYPNAQTFTVTVSDASGAYAMAVDGVPLPQDDDGSYVKTLAFENKIAYGTLTFDHTVTHENPGAHEAPTDEKFTFRLTTDPAQANAAFTVSVDGAAAQTVRFDGSGVYAFTLDNYVYGAVPGKLLASKTVTFDGLPTGVTYTIETASGGDNYSTSGPDQAELTSANLTDDIAIGHSHIPGGLVIYNKVSDPYLSKIGEGESPFGTTFTFTVKATRDGEPVELSDPGLTEAGNGAYTFTLRDRGYQVISRLQKDDEYEITETPSVYYSASNDSGADAATIASGAVDFGTSGDKSMQVRFTNTLRSGNLSITKRVSGAGAPGRQFQAVLTLTAGGYEAAGWRTIAGLITKENLVRELGSGAVASVEDVTASGVVTAKKLTLNITDGQTLTLHDLPAGLDYAVTENASGGFTASYAGATGTISEKPAANSVTITNSYNTSGLTVKCVMGEGGNAYRAFDIRVALSGGGYGGFLNGTYAVSLTKGGTGPRAAGNDITSLTFHNGAASFSLYGGEALTIAGLPLGVGYTVEQTDDAARLGYLVTYPEGRTGTMTASGNSVTVQNDYGAGALAVTNRVTGAGGDKDKPFRFTVTVNGTPAVNGPRGELTFTDGVATFTLADGQTVTAPGLPAGASYTVREDPADSEGYTVTYAGGDTADGAGGTILLGETAAITVTNHRDEPAPTASPEPTATATPPASPEPTATAAPEATPGPTAAPTPTPTAVPTAAPTAVPTAQPTDEPPATSEPFRTPEPDATASPEPTASPAPAAPTATRDPSAPATGDGTDAAPWAAMLGLCLMGLAAVLVFRRRRHS